MAGAGQLQPAARHSTVRRSHHRHGAKLRAVKHGMPHTRMVEALSSLTLLKFVEIQARTKVIALTMQHSRLSYGRQRLKQVA